MASLHILSLVTFVSLDESFSPFLDIHVFYDAVSLSLGCNS